MKHLVRPDSVIDYPDDVQRLRTILERHGYAASDADIQWAWSEYSEAYCCSWMIFEDLSDTRILNAMLKYLEQADGS